MNHRRIDVHHHIPPSYVAWLRGTGIHEAGGRDLPAWSPEAALDAMDEHFIETAIVSLSTPGVRPTPDTSLEEARHRAREVNECAAEHARNHPGRLRAEPKRCREDTAPKRCLADSVAARFERRDTVPAPPFATGGLFPLTSLRRSR